MCLVFRCLQQTLIFMFYWWKKRRHLEIQSACSAVWFSANDLGSLGRWFESTQADQCCFWRGWEAKLSRWSHNPLKLERYQYPLPICVLLIVEIALAFNSKQILGQFLETNRQTIVVRATTAKGNFAIKNNLRTSREAFAILVNCAFRSDLAQPLQNALLA